MSDKLFEFTYNKTLGIEESLSKVLSGMDIRGRCLGTTTGQALEFIGALMQKPGVPATVPQDHHNKTEEMRRVMASRVSNLIKQLGLVGFEQNTSMSFVYKPTGVVHVLALP